MHAVPLFTSCMIRDYSSAKGEADLVYLPGSVNGNTTDFGSVFPGSSPGRAVLRLPRFARSLSTSLSSWREEKYPERVRSVATNESKDNVWFVYILKCKNGDLYTGITDNLQRRFNEHASGKGGHFTKSFIAEETLFSEEHPDKLSALKREAQIKGWTRKKKLALVKGDLELLKKL